MATNGTRRGNKDGAEEAAPGHHHQQGRPEASPKGAHQASGASVGGASPAAAASSASTSHHSTSPCSGLKKPPRGGPHLNGLGSLWIGLGATAVQLYLVVQGVRRFILYAAMPWGLSAVASAGGGGGGSSVSPGPPPLAHLNAYAALLAAALLLMPFLLAAAAFKVGNLANDGARLGAAPLGLCSADPPQSVLLTGRPGPTSCGGSSSSRRRPRSSRGEGGTTWWRQVWLHGPPTAATLHASCATCLLLAKLILQAQLIRHGFVPAEGIWHTDLDAFFPSASVSASWESESVLSFSTSVNSSSAEEPSPSSSASTASSSGGAGGPWESGEAWGMSGGVSAEVANLAAALVWLSVRYPASLWRTCKPMASLFSTALLASSAQTLLLVAAVQLLYKAQVNGEMPDPASPGPSESSLPWLGVGGVGATASTTLVLLAASVAASVASASALHLYGLARLRSFVLRRRRDAREVGVKVDAGVESASGAYTPHCAALAALAAQVLSDGPLLHQLLAAHRHGAGVGSAVVLAAAMGVAIRMLTWVCLWLVLTLRRKWRFKVSLAYPVSSSSSASSASGSLALNSPDALRTTTQVALRTPRQGDTTDADAPLLVVSEGRALAVSSADAKRAIMSTARRAAAASAGGQSEGRCGGDGTDTEEQIYWLRPSHVTRPSPGLATPQDDAPIGVGASDQWRRRGGASASASPASGRHKVTFATKRSGSVRVRGASPGGRRLRRRSKDASATGGYDVDDDDDDEDDGDYAILRDLPLLPNNKRVPATAIIPVDAADGDDDSDDNRLLDTLPTDSLSFASGTTAMLPCDDDDDDDDDDVRALVGRGSYVNAPVVVHGGAVFHPMTSPSPRRQPSADSGIMPSGGDALSTGSGASSSASPPESGDSALASVTSTSTTTVAAATVVSSPWRSMSLQRATSSSATALVEIPPPGYASLPPAASAASAADDVIIRRKRNALRPRTTDLTPFERATNMRMTSFADPLPAPHSTIPNTARSFGIPGVASVHGGGIPAPWTRSR